MDRGVRRAGAARASMPGGLPMLRGLSPGVLLVPGVGASFLGVGVLDFRLGVEDLSLCGWSLALDEGVLPEEATEAGLLGPASFFKTRDLSRPFSGGEWAGLTRGVAGSSFETSTTRSSLLSPSLSYLLILSFSSTLRFLDSSP